MRRIISALSDNFLPFRVPRKKSGVLCNLYNIHNLSKTDDAKVIIVAEHSASTKCKKEGSFDP